MSDDKCPRCGHKLELTDDGRYEYCTHCWYEGKLRA
jgi:DNA-directed RNA polymerase subunit RPC12/RpoP